MSSGFQAAIGGRGVTQRNARHNYSAYYNYNQTRIRRLLAAPGVLGQVPGIVLFGFYGRFLYGRVSVKF